MECPNCHNNVLTIVSVDEPEDREPKIYTYVISCEECGYWFDAYTTLPLEQYLIYLNSRLIIKKE